MCHKTVYLIKANEATAITKHYLQIIIASFPLPFYILHSKKTHHLCSLHLFCNFPPLDLYLTLIFLALSAGANPTYSPVLSASATVFLQNLSWSPNHK